MTLNQISAGLNDAINNGGNGSLPVVVKLADGSTAHISQVFYVRQDRLVAPEQEPIGQPDCIILELA